MLSPAASDGTLLLGGRDVTFCHAKTSPYVVGNPLRSGVSAYGAMGDPSLFRGAAKNCLLESLRGLSKGNGEFQTAL